MSPRPRELLLPPVSELTNHCPVCVTSTSVLLRALHWVVLSPHPLLTSLGPLPYPVETRGESYLNHSGEHTSPPVQLWSFEDGPEVPPKVETVGGWEDPGDLIQVDRQILKSYTLHRQTLLNMKILLGLHTTDRGRESDTRGPPVLE